MWGGRVAVAVAGLALLLAGCGNQVVPGEQEVRPKLPITASGSARSGVATPGGDEPLLYPERAVDFRLAPGIEPPARTAAAYRLVPEGVDRQRVARLARALGLDAEVDEVGGTFSVESGSRRLLVDRDGWDYIGDADGAGVTSDVAVSCAAGEECPPPPPPPPPGVPSAAEAETKALEVLSEAGIDLRGAETEAVEDSAYGRTVSFVPQAGGREVVGLDTSVTFGEDGRVEQARGFFGRFESVGEYPLIDLQAAVARHRSGFGGNAATLQTVPSHGTSEPTAGSVPAPSQPPSEPEVFELTGVELVLEVVEPFCPGDTVYLVPTFAFEPDEVVLVPAVADEELAGVDQPPEAPQTPCPSKEPTTVPPAGKPEPAPAAP